MTSMRNIAHGAIAGVKFVAIVVGAMGALAATVVLSHGDLLTSFALYGGLIAMVAFYLHAQKQTPDDGPAPRIDPWD